MKLLVAFERSEHRCHTMGIKGGKTNMKRAYSVKMIGVIVAKGGTVRVERKGILGV
jgi:hypothetical protein